MKNIMILFLVFTTFTISAQNPQKAGKVQKKEVKENFTPDQRAELFSKKMTLSLDLTDIQQKKVKQLFLQSENPKNNPSKEKSALTSEEKYALMNARMDNKIRMNRELKEILTPEQFEKWEKKMGQKEGKNERGNAPRTLKDQK